MTRDELREALAALAHEQWAGWTAYMISKFERHADGSLVIPEGYLKALQRQINTPYAELLESEQDADRAEADRVLAILVPLFIEE